MLRRGLSADDVLVRGSFGIMTRLLVFYARLRKLRSESPHIRIIRPVTRLMLPYQGCKPFFLEIWTEFAGNSAAHLRPENRIALNAGQLIGCDSLCHLHQVLGFAVCRRCSAHRSGRRSRVRSSD